MDDNYMRIRMKLYTSTEYCQLKIYGGLSAALISLISAPKQQLQLVKTFYGTCARKHVGHYIG